MSLPSAPIYVDPHGRAWRGSFVHGYTLSAFWSLQDLAGPDDRRATWGFPGAHLRAWEIAADSCVTYPRVLPRIRARLAEQAGRLMADVRR